MATTWTLSLLHSIKPNPITSVNPFLLPIRYILVVTTTIFQIRLYRMSIHPCRWWREGVVIIVIFDAHRPICRRGFPIGSFNRLKTKQETVRSLQSNPRGRCGDLRGLRVVPRCRGYLPDLSAHRAAATACYMPCQPAVSSSETARRRRKITFNFDRCFTCCTNRNKILATIKLCELIAAFPAPSTEDWAERANNLIYQGEWNDWTTPIKDTSTFCLFFPGGSCSGTSLMFRY